MLQSLGRDSKVTRIELPPLSADQVAVLIDASGSDVRVEQAIKSSGGNPLFVLELTRAKLAHSAPRRPLSKH
ncbi:putative ATPase [Paraburkholderia sp. JPY465]|uniref:hypothetical protein n=1 Tax=Paraburkholderia sp. JPY465 TaxID=3042285 RepID=UPI003D22A292